MTSYTEARDAISAAIEALNEKNAGGLIDDLSSEIYSLVEDIIPVYNGDIISLWGAIPTYDAEDYSGGYDIIEQMKAAIHEWAYWEIEKGLDWEPTLGYCGCGCNNPYCQV